MLTVSGLGSFREISALVWAKYVGESLSSRHHQAEQFRSDRRNVRAKDHKDDFGKLVGERGARASHSVWTFYQCALGAAIRCVPFHCQAHWRFLMRSLSYHLTCFCRHPCAILHL